MPTQSATDEKANTRPPVRPQSEVEVMVWVVADDEGNRSVVTFDGEFTTCTPEGRAEFVDEFVRVS